MTDELWVLKLGGGAVTHKRENRRAARCDVIRSAARQIARAGRDRPALVVVHGAGPFGHSLVAEYGINDGVVGARQVEGFVRTHNSMEDLNKAVMDLFREEGLWGFPVQPSACVVQRDRSIETFFVEPVERLLDLSAEIIPILYGDMVTDLTLGGSVVSGDVLVAFLARHLGARRVLLGTDVAGVFTADPRLDPEARRIERIDRTNLQRVLDQAGESAAVDVTRGMRGKIERLFDHLSGVSALVFDLTAPGALYSALVGADVAGTEIFT
jgi:isopentenyl phosphate kinase